jgi:kynurenine formamidase
VQTVVEAVPAYDALPRHEVLGLPHAWEVLDPDIGMAAFAGPEQRVRAAREVTLGESFGLSLRLGEIDPPLFGRAPHVHRVVEADRNSFEDVLDAFNPQASSQWDGLMHVSAREFGFFAGQPGPTEAGRGVGVAAWASTGIVGRGVLLDVPRWQAAVGVDWDAFAGTSLTPEDLQACAEHLGVVIERGDLLCVRTGWVQAYRAASAAERDPAVLGSAFSGLCASEDMARFIWDSGFAAVCADNPALESAPGDRAQGSLHRRLIPMLGACVGELLDFEALSARCAEVGRWTFLLTAAPLPLRGGVSSPANAVALL